MTTKPKINVSELARKSGVDRSNLRKTIEGMRGLTFPVAKAVAQVYGTDAITLYVLSQARALEEKAQAGDVPAMVRGVASVMDVLGQQTEKDLVAGGAELAEAIKGITALLEQAKTKASTFAKPAGAQDAAEPTKLSNQVLRDAFGAVRRHEATTKAARDAFGIRGTNGTGSERDAHGRKMG